MSPWSRRVVRAPHTPRVLRVVGAHGALRARRAPQEHGTPAAGCVRSGDGGWVAITTLVAALAAALLALLAVGAVTDVLRSHAVARTAADAAALAAVGASPVVGGDGDPAAAAAGMARVNGARLVDCDCALADHATVEVAVTPHLAPVRAVLPELRIRSAAELRPAR